MDIKTTNILNEQYGAEITLSDEEGKDYVFHLILELVADGKHYAYFQEKNNEVNDIEVLEVVKDVDGALDLITIDDDDEWESAVELFDEWSLSTE